MNENTMTHPRDMDDQKIILKIYAAFAAGIFLSFLPFTAAAILSLILTVGVLVVAGRIRKQARPGNLAENHMIYIVRTIWIGGLYTLITLAAGSFYLFRQVDHTPLEPCMNSFVSGGGTPETLDYKAVETIFQGCYEPFLQGNMGALITAATIAAGPVIIFFLWRIGRGLSRAAKGYRLANPQSWL